MLVAGGIYMHLPGGKGACMRELGFGREWFGKSIHFPSDLTSSHEFITPHKLYHVEVDVCVSYETHVHVS